MAVANYQRAYGQFPPAYLTDALGRPAHSWRVLLLPFLEQAPLYNEYNFSEPWNGPNNHKLAARMPSVYAFHGDWRPGLVEINYLAVVGAKTAWPGARGLSSDAVPDGASSTILLVENQGAGISWMEPRDLAFETMSFRVNSPKGVSSKYEDAAVAMLDGSLYRLEKDLQAATLRALLTVNGGENVQQKGARWALLPDGRNRALAAPPGKAKP